MFFIHSLSLKLQCKYLYLKNHNLAVPYMVRLVNLELAYSGSTRLNQVKIVAYYKISKNLCVLSGKDL